MLQFYRQQSVQLGSDTQQGGHLVYPHASHHQTPIVFKKNKGNNPELSRFEVAFGQLARLFLSSSLVPQQYMVKNDHGDIMGVSCEHMSHSIANHETLRSPFYEFDFSEPDRVPRLIEKFIEDPAKTPFHFFRDLPQGFFRILLKAAEEKRIHLNMESLAQVLAGSYTLEEDDLHKGNFGFYVIKKDGRPHVSFFKIDHDLMFSDSIMSHLNSRFLNWTNGSHAFDITPRDLINFPRLTDSKNFYWPTVKRPLLGIGKKAYITDDEVEAFASLATSEEFKRCKWQAFYKHILIPSSLIQQQLCLHLDYNVAKERADIAMIVHSVVARQAKLRAVLFSIPEFRNYVQSLSEDDRKHQVSSIVQCAEHDSMASLFTEIEQSILTHQQLCQPGGGFIEGDTPLHAAIRLQDYRYHDTWQAFSHYAEQKNQQGKTPLDVAVSRASIPLHESDDIRGDAVKTMRHLLREGVKTTDDYQRFAQDTPINLKDDLLYAGSYRTRAFEKGSVVELKELLRDLGEDHRYSLKMQKELAVICVQQFIETHRNSLKLALMLNQLKKELNGSSTEAPAPELQFIRQLRSQLWIVRIFRGLLGGTSTQMQLNGLINKELARSSTSSASCCTFFSKRPSESQGRSALLHIPTMADDQRLSGQHV